MFKRIKAIIKKELYHILRDPRTLSVIFAMPVMMVLLYGYALNMDIKFIPIGVIDYDHSADSRALIRDFDASEYFDIKEFTDNYDTIDYHLETGKIKAGLVIPKGFGENRNKQPVSHIQLLVDGSDPTYGNAAVNYSSALVSLHSTENQKIVKLVPINFSDRFLYNPDLKVCAFHYSGPCRCHSYDGVCPAYIDNHIP